MSTTTPTASSTGLDVAGDRDDSRAPARRSTETKASLITKTRASTDTGRLLNELVAVLRLTRVEAHTARLRVGQARTAPIRRELQHNAREADQRAELIQDQLRRLGGTPDALADALGFLTVLTKSAAERVQPLSEGLLGDLALEHQLRDRVVFIRVLAEAGNASGVADLMRQLEAAHTERIEWIRLRLAEVAQGAPAALAPTAAQASVGAVARLATLPARQSADLINKAAELMRRGQSKAGQTIDDTRQKAQQTARAAEEVLEASRDAALERAEEVAPSENGRAMVRQTRKSLGSIEPQALPIDDYDTLTGARAIAAVKQLDGSEEVRLVLSYEQAHKDRKMVAGAAQKRLTELAEQALTS